MNLFELFVKIGVDDQASDKISSLSSKLGGGLATAAKVGAAAVSAAGTAIVAIGKQAIEQYAEYEQLVGGVETLFKQSADTGKMFSKLWILDDGEKAPNTFKTIVTLFSNEVAIDFFTFVLPSLLQLSKGVSPLLNH